jgi:hypothetical protein
VLLSVFIVETRTCEWLPEIAHLHIFVHVHKNADEPVTNLQLHIAKLWQGFVAKCMAVVI